MNAATGDFVCAIRRYFFGVKHDHRHAARSAVAWRRSTWKYCAAVDGYTTRRLSSAQSVRKRSMRALECSGPWPSKPWGSSSPRLLRWPHLSSAATMNWSMMIWAPLAKSPNCASHSTSASGLATE